MDKYLSYLQDLDDKEFRIFISSIVLKLPKTYVAKSVNLTIKELSDKIKIINEQKELMYIKAFIQESVLLDVV